MEHHLKTWPNSFKAILDGTKRFEWRRDDRGFEVGDILVLELWDPTARRGLSPGEYIVEGVGLEARPKSVRVLVTYILRGLFGVPEGFCIMSIVPEVNASETSALRNVLARLQRDGGQKQQSLPDAEVAGVVDRELSELLGEVLAASGREHAILELAERVCEFINDHAAPDAPVQTARSALLRVLRRP